MAQKFKCPGAGCDFETKTQRVAVVFKFISGIYYTISPKIVNMLGNKKFFNKLCKPCIDALVTRLRKKGIDDSPYFGK